MRTAALVRSRVEEALRRGEGAGSRDHPTRKTEQQQLELGDEEQQQLNGCVRERQQLVGDSEVKKRLRETDGNETGRGTVVGARRQRRLPAGTEAGEVAYRVFVP
ncbi:hypothetical protein CRG98_037478 [Punica granatum]|uniref:Uncharacterized protein n=1 Tax=Punica granatum TaxID=22663 RepID=A0A2I0IFJ2_PUNGR|nr:hypothetical protein CRG98_037478 [Punica granatum]